MTCPPRVFPRVRSVIGADAGNGIRVFIPDIGMFVAGLAIWLLCRSLVLKRPPEDMAQYNADFDAEEQVGFKSTSVFLSVFLKRSRVDGRLRAGQSVPAYKVSL